MDDKVWSIARAGIMGFDYGRLRELPLLPETTWEGSIQHSFYNAKTDPIPAIPGRPFAAYYGAAAIMMIKDEADIIGINLDWLYTIGIRRFIITDNKSVDNSKNIITSFSERYDDVELLYIFDPIVRHLQSPITTSMHVMACKVWRDVKWVFPIDADEFLFPCQSLNVLDAVDPSISGITIQKSVHMINRDQTKFNENFFVTMDVCSPLFSHAPKVAVRALSNIIIGSGNHRANYDRPTDNDLKYVDGLRLGLYYREYPVRSFTHFIRKCVSGAKAVIEAEKFGLYVGGDHWKHWHSILVEGGEAKLYEFFTKEMTRRPNEHFFQCLFDPRIM